MIYNGFAVDATPTARPLPQPEGFIQDVGEAFGLAYHHTEGVDVIKGGKPPLHIIARRRGALTPSPSTEGVR